LKQITDKETLLSDEYSRENALGVISSNAWGFNPKLLSICTVLKKQMNFGRFGYTRTKRAVCMRERQ
jgi:hypothetical protein